MFEKDLVVRIKYTKFLMQQRFLKFLLTIVTILLIVTPLRSEAAGIAKTAALTKAVKMTNETYDYGANYLLVKYKNDPEIHIVLIPENVTLVKGKIAKAEQQEMIGINVSLHAKVFSGKEQSQIQTKIKNKLAELLQDPNVEIAQPEYFYSSSSWTRNGSKDYPNDFNPNFSPLNRHWYYDKAKLAEMWQDQNCQGLNGASPCGGSSSVKVAVIDTGLAYENWTSTYGDVFEQASEMSNVHIVNPYNADQDAYCYIKQFIKTTYNSGTVCTSAELAEKTHANDDNGHGTLVTGLIASNVDNGAGIDTGSVSPAFNVSIMPIKANFFHTGLLNPVYGVWEGNTMMNNFGTLSVYYALDHAIKNGANVINMSFGSNSAFDSLTKSKLDEAAAAGIVIVAAAGNNGANTVQYPAAYDNVIAVGAINSDGTRSSYSNYGSALDMVAYVGDSLAETVFQQSYNCFFTVNTSSKQGNDCPAQNRYISGSTTAFTQVNNQFYGVQGTSFASLQVAAAAALIKSKNPNMTA
ncbi:MAG: S8 family serine peptidase, partial [bacterium]